MNARRLRRAGWWTLAMALLVTPLGWFFLRGWTARMAAGDVGGDGLAMVLVLGVSIAAFGVLIALMLFELARRVAARDADSIGESR